MSTPISVLALVAVSTLSLFLSVLNFSFWRIRRQDRVPLWLAAWLALSVAFTVLRLAQYADLSNNLYIVIPRLLLTAAYSLAWVGYELGNTFVGHRPPRRERLAIVLPLAAIIAVLCTTNLILTDHVILRRLLLGGQFHGVAAGPLYLPVSFFVLGLGSIPPIRLLRTPSRYRREHLLMAAGYLVVIVFSLVDFLSVAFNASWVRLSDLGYLPLAIFFSIIQVQRIERLYKDMDSAVQERTARLGLLNEELHEEVEDRKNAQQALQVSERLYRLLFDSNPQPAWVYDTESLRFLVVNDAAQTEYGYSREEFYGMTIRDIRPPGELSMLMDNLEQQESELRRSGPWKHTRKDGSTLNVEILSHALMFGGKSARLVLVTNITERLKAETALQESEEKYRTVVENADDGIAIIQEGAVKYANRRLVEMSGRSIEEILGRHFDIFVHPEEREKVVQRHARRMAGEDEPETYETVLARKDTSPVLAELTTASITYQGAPAQIVIVRDISKRKEAEQTLHRQLREMTVLNTVATAAAQATHIDELVERVTTAVGNMLYPDNFGMLLSDANTRTWRPHPSYQGIGPDDLNSVHLMSEGIVGRVMATGRSARVGDVHKDSTYRQVTPGIQSELAVPIVVNGKIFGCLNAESRTLHAFTDHDERIMGTIADTMSTAIEKIRLLQVEKRRREEAEILYNTTRDLVVERDLSRLLRIIVETAAGMVSAPSAALYLCEPALRQARCAMSFNTPGDYTGMTLKYGEGAAGKVAETGQPLMIEDYRTWEGRTSLFDNGTQPILSLLAVPLRWQGQVIGVLIIFDNTKVRSFAAEDLRMVNLFANQAAMAVENASLFKEASQRAQEAAVIAEVGRDISETLQLDVILERIAAYAKNLLRARTCAVYLPDTEASRLRAIASLGPSAEEIKLAPVRLGEGVLGDIAVRRVGEIINNIGEDPRAINIPGTEEIPIEHLMGVPVLSKDQLTGLIAVWRIGAGAEFSDGELGFLSSLAGQVAVAIENARLFEDLQRSNLELSLAYDTTLEGWARALELRDKETLGHSRRVTDLTLRLARHLGVPEAELTHIRRGVLLHDIGKMGIPDALLRKTGPLDPAEWDQMRKHPTYAYELLQPIAYLRPALEIPYSHHERWDGSGYPRGLKGTSIPLSARIFMIVDAFDALLNDRPYRLAWPLSEVQEYLHQEAGRLFDPAITEAFLNMMLDEQALPNPEHRVQE
jgi:PAS domain S-box-containing protein